MAYAVAIIEGKEFEDILKEPRTEVIRKYNLYLNEGQIEFVIFHPSYTYENFVEGLRPTVVGGQINYYIEDGIFKRIVKRAIENRRKNYVIIIDEINRANISSVFGELITLIDKDKRVGNLNGIITELPYSKEKFFIPNNLFIIGTMNTIDSSISVIDIAFRRRFEFEEILPDTESLKNIKIIDNENKPVNIDLSRLLKAINDRVEKLIDRDKTVGQGYFLEDVKNDTLTLKELNKIFKNKIIPLLQEYFLGDWNKIREVLNDKDTGYFIKKDANYITDELKDLLLSVDAFINIYREKTSFKEKNIYPSLFQ